MTLCFYKFACSTQIYENFDPNDSSKLIIFMKNLHFISLPFLLAAVEDVRNGLREPRSLFLLLFKTRIFFSEKALFNNELLDFMQFVKKAKNDKKKKKGFAEFDSLAFLNQQIEKTRATNKNYLFYFALREYQSTGKYKQAIHEILYYFSEKKFEGTVRGVPPNCPIERVMQGLEHHFYHHLLRWETTFWIQALSEYVKRQEKALHDMKSNGKRH